jgi:ATP-dependent helicase/nuclease subunit A
MSAPTTRLVDHDARERITVGGVNETLFVEAGAGTGKTSTLVARIVQLVLHEEESLADLAAITFTEAAAAELRDRVRHALVREAAEGDESRRERAAAALADFDVAAITTLHGFALRLLSEHPIDVAIPPRVEVLDEVQSLLAFEDRWQKAVQRWQTDPRYEAHVVRLWSCNIELRRRNGSSLQDVAAVFDDNWDRLEDLPVVALRDPVRLDRTALRAAIDAALACRSWCTNPDDRMVARIDEREPQLRTLRDVDPDDDERLLTLLAAHTKLDHGNAGSKKHWPDLGAVRACLQEVDAEVAALRRRAVDDILTIWMGILRDLTLEAALVRRDAGRLEFHDLLVLARRLLRTSPAARRAVHQRYRRLLLDEFQDTDPIQIELALRIAAAPDAQPADWRALEPPPGRLFVVGDPKQSIYRFRRADIGLFHQARTLFGDDAAVSLTQNFRTVEPIVAWVNAVFDALMPEATPSQPRYRPLVAARAPSAPSVHLVTRFGPAHPDAPSAADLREREAADVAAIIADIRAHPASRPVAERHPDGERWRPARLADVTILIPSRTSLPMLEAALAALDLPYRVDTSTLVFDSPEVRDLLTVLRALDDPADAVAVVGALRSPLFACADTDLFDWAQAGGRWDYRQAARPDHEPADAASPVVAAALGRLSTWHDDARWCEPAVLLERIVRERDVFVVGLTERRPRDAWRRTRFLIDQARQFADVQGGHLRAFVRWAELQRNEGARVPEPLLPDLDDDAVRIMTFHGAKGLEFPIVILSGLTTRPRAATGGPQVRWETTGHPQVTMGKQRSTDRFDVLNEFESEMDADEKLRLLYVGATRARDHLFVSTHRLAKDADKPDATFATRLDAVCEASAADLTATWVPDRSGDASLAPVASVLDAPVAAVADASVADASVVDEPVAAFVEWCDRRARLLAVAATHRPVWSATALAATLVEREGSVDLPDGAEGGPPVVPGEGDVAVLGEPDALGVEPWPGGTAFGRAVHAVLEHAPAACAAAELAEIAARAAGAEGQSAALVARAAGEVLASPTVRRALASAHWRELELAAPLGGSLVEGVIDLLADIDGALVLVDYKTDRVPISGLDARVTAYAPQLATYALAVETITGRPVARAVLVFVGPDGAVEREVPDLAAVCATVRRALDAG